mmetsp:Transcript_22721/g.40485  ORF Transcript_22721/g.40485 Transcript_22721/m.40485 type:complete len:210 (+) Transcript_22721:1989-2618(+)
MGGHALGRARARGVSGADVLKGRSTRMELRLPHPHRCGVDVHRRLYRGRHLDRLCGARVGGDVAVFRAPVWREQRGARPHCARVGQLHRRPLYQHCHGQKGAEQHGAHRVLCGPAVQPARRLRSGVRAVVERQREERGAGAPGLERGRGLRLHRPQLRLHRPQGGVEPRRHPPLLRVLYDRRLRIVCRHEPRLAVPTMTPPTRSALSPK